jgi:hypothetical protein
MSEWHEIDTAPKDGTWILVCEPSGTWMDVVTFRGDQWVRFNNSTYLQPVEDLSPTHWQPLPEPPKE